MDADINVASVSIDDTRRDYPCPECSEKVDETHVSIIAHHSAATALYRDEPGFMDHVARVSARALADELLTGGFMSIETGPVDKMRQTLQVRATLGVVSKTAVASIEERVAARQFDMAEKVVAEAKRLVSVWGRDYGDPNISKSRAYDSINEALAAVATKRSNKREG
jgi:hypothetical protein